MIRVCMSAQNRAFRGSFSVDSSDSVTIEAVKIEQSAKAEVVPPAARRAFDPTHPAIVVLTVVCALLCLLDAGLIVLISVEAGPWDTLEDPTRALEVSQRLEAVLMRDDIASAFQPLSASDLAVASEDAAAQWNELRDEAIWGEVIDDPWVIGELRDHALLAFDPSQPTPALALFWRTILGTISASMWALPLVALLWLVWRRTELIRPCPAGLSLPIADSASGISAAVIVMGSLSAWTLLLGIVLQFLPIPDELALYLSSSTLLMWIAPTLLLLWLCTVSRNGSLATALGFKPKESDFSLLQWLGSLLFLLGSQEILLYAIGIALPDWSTAGAWWEGFDELITFGPLSIALLDTLDAVVGAPIVEEIIFRGLLFGALVRSMGFVAAAIVSSLVFAAVHGYGLEGTLAVTLTGSLLCWIYWRTGRLWTAILAHGVHNTIVVLPMWAARAMSVGAN